MCCPEILVDCRREFVSANAGEKSLVHAGEFKRVGVFRLRKCFAARSACSAQDDKSF